MKTLLRRRLVMFPAQRHATQRSFLTSTISRVTLKGLLGNHSETGSTKPTIESTLLLKAASRIRYGNFLERCAKHVNYRPIQRVYRYRRQPACTSSRGCSRICDLGVDRSLSGFGSDPCQRNTL